jgi:hypothetical protein
MDTKKYIVMVDDNYHFMDTDYRSKDGEYDTEEEAIARCKEIVEVSCGKRPRKGLSAEELYSGWMGYGEDPFIVSNAALKTGFSARKYAKEYCRKIVTPTWRSVYACKRTIKRVLRCL